LTISDLTKDTNSLITFLNTLDDPGSYAFSLIDISDTCGKSVTGVVMSKRPFTSVDLKSTYLTFWKNGQNNMSNFLKIINSGDVIG